MSQLLRWEKQRDAWLGHRGRVAVAMVVQVQAGDYRGKWVWEVYGVRMPAGIPGLGHRRSAYEARRAARNAWEKWLIAAELSP